MLLRILVITHNFPSDSFPFHGIFAARQIEEMIEQGADITVLTPQVWCPGILRCFKRWSVYNHRVEFKYHNIIATAVPYIRPPGKWFRLFEHKSLYAGIAKTANRLHNKHHFDIIYARFLFPDGYAATKLAQRWRVPAVGVGAGSEINIYPKESSIFKRNIINTVKQFDHLCTSGDEVARNIYAMTGIAPTIVQGVVDTNKFKPVTQDEKKRLRIELNLPENKRVILFLGSFKRAKGVYELIEAFSNLHSREPDVLLVFCGYGRQEEKMRSLIAERGIADAVLFGGIVHPDKVYKWMQAADVFVLPSYAEGMSNALMEAMSCGLPIVTTRVGGIPTAVGDCDGVVMIDAKDSEQLKNALERVISNKALMEKMVVASREKALRDFSVEKNAKTVLSCLEQTIGKQS